MMMMTICFNEATWLLESSRSRLDLRPRHKWCAMEKLVSKGPPNGPPMKNLVCNEKFGINCASAEAQFGRGIIVQREGHIFSQVIYWYEISIYTGWTLDHRTEGAVVTLFSVLYLFILCQCGISSKILNISDTQRKQPWQHITQVNLVRYLLWTIQNNTFLNLSFLSRY